MTGTTLTGAQMTNFSNMVLVYNLGCEMIYLINHRLQKIMSSEEKLMSTLKDIAKTLYSDKIAHLIENEEKMMSINGVRNILYNICHSSVIVLDP